MQISISKKIYLQISYTYTYIAYIHKYMFCILNILFSKQSFEFKCTISPYRPNWISDDKMWTYFQVIVKDIRCKIIFAASGLQLYLKRDPDTGMCFHVNFAKFLRTPYYFIEHFRWLLLTDMMPRNQPHVLFGSKEQNQCIKNQCSRLKKF